METLNIKVHQRKERVQPRILFDGNGWDTPEDQIQAENEVNIIAAKMIAMTAAAVTMATAAETKATVVRGNNCGCDTGCNGGNRR